MQQRSIADLERLLELQERTFGRESVEAAETCQKLADVHFGLKNFEAAEVYYGRSISGKQNRQDFHQEDIARMEENLRWCKERCHPAPAAAPEVPNYDQLMREQPSTFPCAPPTSPPRAQDPEPEPEAAKEPSPLSARPAGAAEKVDDSIHDVLMELDLLRSFGDCNSAAYANMSTKLAGLYCRKHMYTEMEPLLLEAIRIRKSVFGSNHPIVATSLKNLAELYCHQERFAQAEPLYKDALDIRERVFGHDDNRVVDIEKNYAFLLHKCCREGEALQMEKHVYEFSHRKPRPVAAER